MKKAAFFCRLNQANILSIKPADYTDTSSKGTSSKAL